MKSVTYTEEQENLANTINRVCEDNAPVIITRRRDQAVVVMSLAEFESFQETVFVGKRQAPLEINRVARTRKGSPKEIESERKPGLFEGSVGGISCLATRGFADR